MPAYILRDDITLDWNGHTLKRIQMTGFDQSLGGWVESTANLVSDDTKSAWVSDEGKVYGSAVVQDDGYVGGNADVSGGTVQGSGWVGGKAIMTGGIVDTGGALQQSAKQTGGVITTIVGGNSVVSA